MKLKKVLLMGMICVAGLVSACGKTSVNESAQPSNVEETGKIEQKETEQVSEKVVEKESDLLPGVYQVPGYEIYVNVPDMHPIEEGFTQVYFEDQVKYVTFSCVRTETAVDEKDALEIVFKRLVNNMSGLHTINEMSEVIGENMVINDIPVYAFKGKVNCGSFEIYDAYMKGYSFIYENMPCGIIGVVIGTEQPQEQIDAVKELVDAMILTVRSEK